MMGRVNVPLSRRVCLSVLCLAAFGLSATGARGATCAVTTTADSGAGSLRACLSGLSTGTAVDTNAVTFSVTGTISLASALPTIANGVTITGPGANQLTIDGGGAVQLLTVNGSGISVSITGLTFANGKASGNGGAIDVSVGTVTISNSVFSGNSAADGGAIAGGGTSTTVIGSTFTQNSAANKGGAVLALAGTLTATNNTFYSNSATSGGAIEAVVTATATNNTFYGNSGNYGAAIEVASTGSLTSDNNLFEGNSANGGGAAIYNGNGGTANADHNVYYKNLTGSSEDDCKSCTGNTNATSASSNPLALPLGNYGGTTQTYLPQSGSQAVCAGSSGAAGLPTSDQRGFAMVNSCVDAGAVQTNYIKVTSTGDANNATCPDNTKCSLRAAIAQAAGQGDIDFGVTSATLTGSGLTLALPASGAAGVNIIGSATSLVKVDGGAAGTVFTVNASVPAVLYGLTITNGNASGNGGGINNSGNLTLLASAVKGDTAAVFGGGISNAVGGTLTVVDNTTSGNAAQNGGGIYNAGTLVIEESTVSGNTVSNGSNPANGAGIESSGTLTVISSTIAGNTASGTATNTGGGIYVAGGTAALANTVVSGNSVGTGGTASNISGAFTDHGGNVIGGTTDSTNSNVGGTGAAITLSSLGNYPSSASLQTQLPLPSGTTGNPAICGGTSANVPSSITTDERGQSITPNDCSSGSVDAGAVQTNFTLSFTTNPPSTVTVDQGFGAAVTLDESGQASTASGANIQLALSSGTLKGTATQATSSGVATYSGLSATLGNTLTLNASLVLNGALSISAASSSFDVTAASSTVSLQASSSTGSVGQPLTLTTTVSPSATNLVGATDVIAMTGSVAYTAGAQTLTCSSDTFTYDNTTGTAKDVCVTSNLPAGSPVSVTAAYSGDGNYQPSPQSSAVHVTVSQGSATTSLACTSTDSSSPNCATSVSLNATETFTETVSPPSGGVTPTGTVTFTANGSKITACGTNGVVTLSSGTASCSTSKLKANNYSIVATYSGDSNYKTSTDSISLAVGQAGTTTTLVSNSPGNTSTVNQSVTFTATIGPANANPALSGTVTIVDTSNGNTTLCQGQVNPTTQQYSCTTQALTRGTHKIQATYSNDQNYGSSDNSANLLTQTVNAGTATMPSFSSSSNPSVVGNTVTFTATISVPSGPTSPSGNLSFTADGSTIAGCNSVALTLSSPGATTGTASCSTKTLVASVTPHTIVANYTGDNNFTFDGQNNSLSQTVSAAATTTTIAAAPSTTTVNQPVTYTVTVTAPSTTYPLSGLVKVTDNSTVVCSGLALTQQSGSTVGTNQQCTESNLTAGVHTITATYYNDSNNGTSNGSTTVPVQAASTTVVVVSSLNPSVVLNPKNVNDTVSFTATVASTGAVAVPLSGTVTFTANGLTLPDCPAATVNASGQAICTTTSLVAGTDTILAVYSNDPNYTGSSGYLSAKGQIVPQMVQDFSLVVSSAPPVAVSQGSTTGNDLFTPQTISVVPLSTQGFATASGAPLALACSVTTVFSPTSSPTKPLCTLASGSLAVNGTGAQAAVGLVVDATNASAGLFSVQVSGTDPTTGLMHSSAPFTVTVRAASAPLTFVSGATTGNSGNLTFLLPGGVTLSNLACVSVSGPNLTGSVSPATLGIGCSFNPASVTNSSTTVQAEQVTVTVSTGGSSGTSTAAVSRHTNLWLAGLLGLPLFGLMGLVRGRKSSKSVFFRLIAMVVICAAGFQTIGCGGSFVTQPSNAGSGGKTPPGVYKVLVAGTGSDGQTYQAVLQLNVQL